MGIEPVRILITRKLLICVSLEGQKGHNGQKLAQFLARLAQDCLAANIVKAPASFQAETGAEAWHEKKPLHKERAATTSAGVALNKFLAKIISDFSPVRICWRMERAAVALNLTA